VRRTVPRLRFINQAKGEYYIPLRPLGCFVVSHVMHGTVPVS
jgi:hypothetical protein